MKLSFTAAGSYSAPQDWGGASKDLRNFSAITLWCSSTPSVAPTIETSPDNSVWSTQAAIPAGLDTPVTTVADVGRYDLAGGCYIRLTGGTGGTYHLAASN